ncbi:MAG: 2-oxo acid dehydrogenase subunit E2 [Acidobacteria bacterium]|nr:2-oxo acid dehydrogenase subunit E2 [Acidobacteriota bacterium]
MPTPVVIPKATISMEQGSILRWLKAAGNVVVKDELLFELETDKAILEVPAPSSGVLLRILRPKGEVRVDEVVGWIGQASEEIPEPVMQPSSSLAPIPSGNPPAAQAAESAAPPSHVGATPAARRVAVELGVDVKSVLGTGPGGRITQQDVERAVASRPVARPAGSLGRKELMAHLTAAWQTIPHIHIGRKIDAAGLMEAKRWALEQIGESVSLTDLMLFSLGRLLPQFPALISTWAGGAVSPASEVNLAFAVDTDRGVVAPVIPRANTLGLAELSHTRRQLAESARLHRLKMDQLLNGCFTLTNLGAEGADFFVPILNSPQTAILAVGRILQEPVVQQGEMTLGWRMWANLAVDHRVTDGAAAARFLGQGEHSLAAFVEQLKGVK